LLPTFGPAACFLVNGLTFLAVLAALVALDLPAKSSDSVPHQEESPPGAFQFLARQPALVLLLVLAGVMAFFGWPLLSLLPALSAQQLGTGEGGYAWMLSAVGTGALVGALVVATFGQPQRRLGFLTAGVILSVVSLVVLAGVSTLLPAVAGCALSGCGLILFFATGQAVMQLGADEHNRGRIMGVWLMVLSGAQPAGNLASGLLADVRGVPVVILWQAAGIGVTALVVLVVARGRGFRRNRSSTG
jgi:predicted MFS family arabinose efflux permease